MKKSCHICSMLIAVFSLCMAASAQLGKDWAQATASAGWSPRGYHTSVVCNGEIWVIGGRKPDVWRSRNGLTWTSATTSAPWGARHDHTSVAHEQMLWVMGASSLPSGTTCGIPPTA